MNLPIENERPLRRYVRAPHPVFFPTEAEVPETKTHLEVRTALYLILKHAFADRALIGCEQFVYWNPTDPSECLAPDAFVRLGAPDERFRSWKVWERGAPHVAVEITSGSDKSESAWAQKFEKYRRLGVSELVRFDPEDGEIRIWDNVEGDLVERLISGNPIECVTLGLFWVVVPDASGEWMIRPSRDPAGAELLPAPEEAMAKLKQLEAELAHQRR